MINYEQDFYSWTQEQAALLRSGRLMDFDIDNLIEEIEAMGRTEKRELQSRLMVLLAQLLKWKYQPARRGRSWLLTIKGQRMNLEDVINDNPGLKSQLFDLLAHAPRSKPPSKHGLMMAYLMTPALGRLSKLGTPLFSPIKRPLRPDPKPTPASNPYGACGTREFLARTFPHSASHMRATV